MYSRSLLVLLLATIVACALAEDRWSWSNHQRRERAQHDGSIDRITLPDKYRSELYARSERDREPTTHKPPLGSHQHDEIEDYADPDDKTGNVGTRNYPYQPNGFNGGQLSGFNNFPPAGFGSSAAHGILVGPGGPTGIIGRPQQGFPGGGLGGLGGLGGAGLGGIGGGGLGSIGGGGNFAPGGFGGGQGGFPPQAGAGFPNQAGGGGFGGNGAGPFPQGGFSGQGQLPQGILPGQGGGIGGQFPGVQFAGGQQFPGGQFSGGQFGGGQHFPGGQFGGGQFSGGGAQFGGAQFPGGGQFAGGQFPGGQGQYPGTQFPQYTEGYGLAYTNGFGGPYGGLGGNTGYAAEYDEYDKTKRRLKLEEKSAPAASSNIVDKKVDDKIHKSFKKS